MYRSSMAYFSYGKQKEAKVEDPKDWSSFLLHSSGFNPFLGSTTIFTPLENN